MENKGQGGFDMPPDGGGEGKFELMPHESGPEAEVRFRELEAEVNDAVFSIYRAKITGGLRYKGTSPQDVMDDIENNVPLMTKSNGGSESLDWREVMLDGFEEKCATMAADLIWERWLFHIRQENELDPYWEEAEEIIADAIGADPRLDKLSALQMMIAIDLAMHFSRNLIMSWLLEKIDEPDFLDDIKEYANGVAADFNVMSGRLEKDNDFETGELEGKSYDEVDYQREMLSARADFWLLVADNEKVVANRLEERISQRRRFSQN